MQCPICRKEIKAVLYTEYGRKVWDGKRWVDDDAYATLEFTCPECDCSYDYNELIKLGVI